MSVIENEPAAVKLELTVPPPAVAVDVAVIVHVVEPRDILPRAFGHALQLIPQRYR